MSVYTGDYVRQISSCVPKLTYFTFTPLPLMEGNFYTMDNELAALLSNTHRIFGMLGGGRPISFQIKSSLLPVCCFGKAISLK